MKSLTDVKEDMSTLYEELKTGKVELKTASELANIAGKFLKAEQLELAREIFHADGSGSLVPHRPAPRLNAGKTSAVATLRPRQKAKTP